MKRNPVQGVTIDAEHTRDIDDALWIEFQSDDYWHIFVSIADVASSIPIGGELDTRAREMVTTKYFVLGNSPMLPREFSEDSLSLWPGKKRQTVTVEMTVDTSMNVIKTEIYPSLLKSRARCTYDRVPVIRTDPSHEGHGLILTGCQMAMRLLEGRRKAGAMVLYDLNNGWVTTEEGVLRKIENKDETIGHILVQEMMILANSKVAEFAVLNNIPVLFRNHTPMNAAPDRTILMQQVEDAIHTPMDASNLDQVRQRVHMLLGRANYGRTLLGHYGLNLPAYLHFTSPIRRYADLITQRQINAFIRGEPFPYSKEEVDAIAQHINDTLEAEREKVSEAFKVQVDQKAQRAIDSRRLDGLNATQFERVTKVEARSEADPSKAFQENLLLRLKEGRVPLICLGVLLTQEGLTDAWVPLRQAVLDHLAQHPENAVSLLSMAIQTVGWAETTYQVTHEGPDHARVFSCEAVNGGSRGVGHGLTSKEARAHAAVNLLASRVGLQVVLQKQEVPRRAPPVPTPILDPAKDPVSALMEFVQQSRSPSPVFQFEKTGPDHVPSITCTCSIEVIGRGQVTQKATASSKQGAKKVAAEALLKGLQ